MVMVGYSFNTIINDLLLMVVRNCLDFVKNVDLVSGYGTSFSRI